MFRWETGHATPDEFYRQLLREALGMDAANLHSGAWSMSHTPRLRMNFICAWRWPRRPMVREWMHYAARRRLSASRIVSSELACCSSRCMDTFEVSHPVGMRRSRGRTHTP